MSCFISCHFVRTTCFVVMFVGPQAHLMPRIEFDPQALYMSIMFYLFLLCVYYIFILYVFIMCHYVFFLHFILYFIRFLFCICIIIIVIFFSFLFFSFHFISFCFTLFCFCFIVFCFAFHPIRSIVIKFCFGPNTTAKPKPCLNRNYARSAQTLNLVQSVSLNKPIHYPFYSDPNQKTPGPKIASPITTQNQTYSSLDNLAY